MADAIYQLLSTETVGQKLSRRGISLTEVHQLLANRHVVLRNPRPALPIHRRARTRRLMIGLTDGGRALTLVVERTIDPTTWLVVTGWDSASHERRMLWRRK